MTKSKVLTYLLLTFSALTVNAGLSNNDKARNAIAIGRVTYQCGQDSHPKVFVSPKYSIDLASAASGLNYPEVLSMLRTGNSQELVQHRVNELTADIKAGRKTCPDLLSKIYGGMPL